MMTYSMKTRCWHQPGDLDLAFADRWEVSECRMQGHSSPRLSSAGIEHALANPIGSSTLAILETDYPGAATVALVPDGTTQYISA